MELLKKNKILIMVSVFFVIILLNFTFSSKQQQSGEWNVPEEYKKMKNPTDPNEKDLKYGKSLYAKHCKACHGVNGNDGLLNAGDFTTKTFQSQTDGVLFYKIQVGRNSMPGYEKSIPEEEDRWLIVNYIRSFNK